MEKETKRQRGEDEAYRLAGKETASKTPTVNINVSMKHAALNSLKIFQVKHIHPYKTVSTTRNTTNSPNPGSYSTFRRAPWSKIFCKKVLTNLVKDTNPKWPASESQGTTKSPNPHLDSQQNRSQTADKNESMENTRLESMENAADSHKSMQNAANRRESNAHPEHPPNEANMQTSDRNDVSQTSQNSVDELRSDPNDSMENLKKTLEGSNSGTNTETDDSSELHIDEQETDTNTPDTIKNTSF
ncbi:unnamed protein product [Psylliodes chrysocephalus]|uniref:Uncharacterized protein n=1 Tax=Psylliodes chrysocephalus TaxID=3402493 RepID=A0A9P0G7W9_9CUCU|nr:unnamed protein product [Psylliodes chrysocephala]